MDETKIDTIIDEATFEITLYIYDLDDPTVGELEICDKNNILGPHNRYQERVMFEKFFRQLSTEIALAAKADPQNA